MPDGPDDAHRLPRPARDGPAEHPVGIAGPVDVGGDHGVDPLVGRHHRDEALVVHGLAEVHEPAPAPCADRHASGIDMGGGGAMPAV